MCARARGPAPRGLGSGPPGGRGARPPPPPAPPPAGARARRARTGEISRLIIAPQYRAAGTREPLILFGLFRHLYEESWRMGLDFLIAAMEPKLARLLRRLGFALMPMGAPINYFGEVVPYGASLASMRPGYKKILAYQRSCVGGGRPAFRYFRVSAAHLAATRLGERRDCA